MLQMQPILRTCSVSVGWPEAWIAPPAIRELRELVRYRAKLVQLRTGLKAQVHAVMAKEGVLPSVGDMFCKAGNRQLDQMGLASNYAARVRSLRELIAVYDHQIVELEKVIHDSPCVTTAAIRRSKRSTGSAARSQRSSSQRSVTSTASTVRSSLCSWAGLTPKHRESDTKTRRGAITKQGSSLLRWALIEGISRYHGGPHLAASYSAIAKRRGANKARVAIARRTLTLVFYGLRDGEIRCLAPAKAA